jgi:hypothetical protein
MYQVKVILYSVSQSKCPFRKRYYHKNEFDRSKPTNILTNKMANPYFWEPKKLERFLSNTLYALKSKKYFFTFLKIYLLIGFINWLKICLYVLKRNSIYCQMTEMAGSFEKRMLCKIYLSKIYIFLFLLSSFHKFSFNNSFDGLFLCKTQVSFIRNI